MKKLLVISIALAVVISTQAFGQKRRTPVNRNKKVDSVATQAQQLNEQVRLLTDSINLINKETTRLAEEAKGNSVLAEQYDPYIKDLNSKVEQLNVHIKELEQRIRDLGSQ